MQYTLTECVWLVIVYSFLGWTIETVTGTIKKKTFVNRGFSTGPFCLVYGIGALVMVVAFQELKSNLFFLFLGCAVLGTMLEWITGKLLERMNQHKWWDYSDKRWNFDGYICLQYTVLWGILGMLTVRYGDENIVRLLHVIPDLFGTIVVWTLAAVCALDMAASYTAIIHIRRPVPKVVRIHRKAAVVLHTAIHRIIGRVERRIVNVYPVEKRVASSTPKTGKFAEGCGFYKLFWLFLIGAVLGDFTETIFCRLTAGIWMSRSSLVWGPFSIVWGLAIAAATALLYKDRDKPDRYLFFVGTFLGGGYEYLCSVFTEIVFGKIFWDYSEIPFNLGGRINLLYCFFWGFAAVIWIKILYPRFSAWIEKLPAKAGCIFTWVLVIFMIANITVSMLALIRYDMRVKEIPPSNALERLIDERFDDQRMEQIYPNAKEK